MMTGRRKNSMGGILALLVFAVFVVALLMVLLTGADVVRKLTERDRLSYDRRTAVQYITTRVHQADAAGALSIRSFGGADSLVISEDIDGTVYETLIYCHDGYLRELFCQAGAELAPEFGEEILPLAAFSAGDMGDYLQLELTAQDGQTDSLCLMLRSEKREDGR